MRRLRMWVVRLAGVFGTRARERDFARELESHLELHIEDAIRTGMTRDEARRHAVLALGGVEQAKERWREPRSLLSLEQLIQDVRYGARVLRRNAGFTAI